MTFLNKSNIFGELSEMNLGMVRVFVCSDNMVAELESFTGLIQRVKGYVRIRHSHTLNSLAFLRSLRYIDGENLLDEYDHTHTHPPPQLNIWMMVGVSLLSVCSFYSSVFVEVQGPPELCLWPICDNLFLSLVVFSRVAVLMKMVLFVLSVKVPLVSG